MGQKLFIVASMLRCRTTAFFRTRLPANVAAVLVLVLIIQPLGAG